MPCPVSFWINSLETPVIAASSRDVAAGFGSITTLFILASMTFS
jgi:hypothetical protein